MPRKVDRRIQRTRNLLREALITLTLQHGYDAITIQDITDHANLGRATFYLHYKDKDDLLLSTLQEIIDDLLEIIAPPDIPTSQRDYQATIRDMVTHAAEHADLYRIILRGSGAAHVERRLREIAMNLAHEFVSDLLGDRPSPISLDLVANFYARSVLGTIEWWLDQGMPHPPEYVAEAINALCLETIFRTLDITLPGDQSTADDA